MEIIDDRHGKRSTLLSSQVPVDVWHAVIGEQTVADATSEQGGKTQPGQQFIELIFHLTTTIFLHIERARSEHADSHR